MEYSISDFSKLTGLGIHTLRYYEHESLIAPEKNSSTMPNSGQQAIPPFLKGWRC